MSIEIIDNSAIMKVPTKEVYTKVHAFYSIYYGYPYSPRRLGTTVRDLNEKLCYWRGLPDKLGSLMDDFTKFSEVDDHYIKDRMLFLSEINADNAVLEALEEYKKESECPDYCHEHIWSTALYYLVSISVMGSIAEFYNPSWIMEVDKE